MITYLDRSPLLESTRDVLAYLSLLVTYFSHDDLCRTSQKFDADTYTIPISSLVDEALYITLDQLKNDFV